MARKSPKSQQGGEEIRAASRINEPQRGSEPLNISRGNGNGGTGEQSASDIFNTDEIAQRAYQIFEREGRMDGRDMDHWLQAERELRMEREQRTHLTAENAPRSARQHQPSR
jgi:hypothetical protein